MCRCGTSGYGLVGMVVLGGWLDLILEVFSNLWFYGLLFLKGCIAGADGPGWGCCWGIVDCAILVLSNENSSFWGVLFIFQGSDNWLLSLDPSAQAAFRPLTSSLQWELCCRERKSLGVSPADPNSLPVYKKAKSPWMQVQIWKTGLPPNELQLPFG